MSLHRMLHHIFARSLAVMPVPTAQALIAPADTPDRMSGCMPASSTAWITPAPKYAAGAPPPDRTSPSPGTSVGPRLGGALAAAARVVLHGYRATAVPAAVSTAVSTAVAAGVPAVRIDLLPQGRVGAGQRVQVPVGAGL